MKKIILPFVGAVGVFLAACLAAPNEPSSSTSSALSCAAPMRAFNGACRATCMTSAHCASPNTCMTVSEGVSLCLDYSSCAYLGDDTECSGVPFGGYGYGYSSAESNAYGAYTTPTSNPYASPNSYYASSEPFGCGGNAVWQSQPPASSGDPKCGAAHQVMRCRKLGNRCALVPGTTIDVADR